MHRREQRTLYMPGLCLFPPPAHFVFHSTHLAVVRLLLSGSRHTLQPHLCMACMAANSVEQRLRSSTLVCGAL